MTIDHLAVLRRECARVSHLARTVDHAAPVAHLPGWTVHDVVAHLAGDFLWVLGTLATRERPRTGLVAVETRGTALCDEWDAVSARLIDRLDGVDPDEPCPNFAFGNAGTLGFHVRHQAHETAIHRWDIEAATGTPHLAIDPDVAADAIDELLATYTVRYSPHVLTAPLVFACTDHRSAWRIAPDVRAGFVTVARCDGAAGSVTAPVADVLLLLWRRLDVGAAHLGGEVDPAAVCAFLDGPITA